MKITQTLSTILLESANNMKTIHLNSFGEKFDRIHQITNDLYLELSEDYDTAAELALENVELITNPNELKAEFIIPTTLYDYDLGIYEVGNILYRLLVTIKEEYAKTDDIGDQNFLGGLAQKYNKHLYFFCSRRLNDKETDA